LETKDKKNKRIETRKEEKKEVREEKKEVRTPLPTFIEKNFIMETRDKNNKKIETQEEEKTEEKKEVKEKTKEIRTPLPTFIEKNFILETRDREVKNSTLDIKTSMDITESNSTHEDTVGKIKEVVESKPAKKQEKSFILETKDKTTGIQVKTSSKSEMVSHDESSKTRSGGKKAEKDLLLETRDRTKTPPMSSKDQSELVSKRHQSSRHEHKAGKEHAEKNFILETKDKRLSLDIKEKHARERKEQLEAPVLRADSNEFFRSMRQIGRKQAWRDTDSLGEDRRQHGRKQPSRRNRYRSRMASRSYRREPVDSLGSLGDSLDLQQLGLDTDLLANSEEDFSLEKLDLGTVDLEDFGRWQGADTAADKANDIAGPESAADESGLVPPSAAGSSGVAMPQFEEKIFIAMSDDDDIPSLKSTHGDPGSDGGGSQEIHMLQSYLKIDTNFRS
jgi:hypothetical protein